MVKELLGILAEERIHGILEETLKGDKEYTASVKAHREACNILHTFDLDKEESLAVDRVISTANRCGASYGAVAYRQGLLDGIALVREMV